jgi:ribosomal protein S18 acetylase RimI-like enzyme
MERKFALDVSNDLGDLTHTFQSSKIPQAVEENRRISQIKSAEAMSYIIRYVSSGAEISEVVETMRPWFVPAMQDRYTLEKLRSHFPEFRDMMITAESTGQIAGGALGYGGTMAIIAVRPGDRRRGLGRRLLQTLEVGAMHHGVTMISLGARREAKAFYERVGYRGKSSMHKSFPLPGRSLSWRLKKVDAVIGDLERGCEITLDDRGRVPRSGTR